MRDKHLIKLGLKQCPYNISVTCIMDEPCKGCEEYKPEQSKGSIRAGEKDGR